MSTVHNLLRSKQDASTRWNTIISICYMLREITAIEYGRECGSILREQVMIVSRFLKLPSQPL